MIEGLEPLSFLRENWQKRPRLFRAAFPGFRSPLDGDELAGLAGDADVESRLVLHEGGRWMLRDGPFNATDFAGLPDHDWTLLVQDVDKHLPDLAAIFDHFDFLPPWRIDDLMVSWAEDGGSVGPHVDNYDVFLLQAHGLRRWQIAAPGTGVVRPREGGLMTLEGFTPDEEWILEPGDMLYLPPGVPHHGIAEGPCMTWSIGFRAPSMAGLIVEFAERIADGMGTDFLYTDPDLTPEEAAGGRLSSRAIERVGTALDSAWRDCTPTVGTWLAEQVTSPKAWLHCVPPTVLIGADDLADRIERGCDLMRDPRARMLWFEDRVAGPVLCVDGACRPVAGGLRPLLELLCGSRVFPAGQLSRYLDPHARALLAELYNGGQLIESEGTHG